MKIFFIGLAFIAAAAAQGISSEYLPPDYSSAASAVDSNVLEYEPAHTLADDGYRYKTVKRFRHRHRRDVSELSNEYLPPFAGASSAPAPVYSAPAPAVSYAAPAAEASYEVAASEPAPAHTLSSDGYRYKTVKRYRVRRRRDVNELSNEYLPPVGGAASAPAPVYSAPAPVHYEAESAPAVSYAAPAAEASYEVAASEPAPAHTLSSDGYRYKTVKRYRVRRRRDVSELSNEYLPPISGAATADIPVFSAPQAISAPAVSYAAPAAEASYEVAASEPAPAHTLSSDGYRYKTVKRYRIRRRRDVSELSNEYLPPVGGASSAPAPVYSAPAPVHYEAASAPAVSYAAPAAEASYEVAASEPAPAHTLSSDGYRYKTVKRYRIRRRRDVSELSNEYLPPVAGASSAPAPVYSAPAPVHYEAASAPAVSYAAPAAEASYEVAASEPAPAHTLSSDGYRYKTVKRYRIRRRRDVSELSNEYLPPFAGASSAPAPVYSAPAPVHYEAESAPAVSYAAPAAEASYEVAASEPAPAHTLSSDGYRYKTVKRYRIRRRRDVSELSNEYLPPVAGASSAPAPVYSAPAPVHYEAASAPAVSYAAPAAEASYEVAASEPAPAHTLSSDGYRYKTVKRYRVRRRRDVSELSNEYLPPVAGASSAPAPVYSAPAPVHYEAASAPAVSYAAPAAEASYEVAASEPAPAHTLSSDGYRYKTVKRYRIRRRRDVNELSNEYLPPVAGAASVSAPVYSAPAPAHYEVESAPAPSYAAPAAEASYEVAASEPAPAHSLSSDGYRYKTVKRYRYRHRH